MEPDPVKTTIFQIKNMSVLLELRHDYNGEPDSLIPAESVNFKFA